MPDFMTFNRAWTETSLGARLKIEVADILREWEAQHQAARLELYHYTTADGLLGVLTKRHLWATDASYLNDRTEGKHAHALMQLAYDAKRKHASPIVQALTTRSIGPSLDGFITHYVTCFCEHGDLLSQWRGYGARGGGYAVRFKFPPIGPPLANIRFRKVIYKADTQRHFIESILGIASTALEAETTGQTLEQARGVIAAASAFVADFMTEFEISFKDPSFAEEHEWRAIQTVYGPAVDDHLKFRVGNGQIVPYRELDLTDKAGVLTGQLPIHQIMIGPTLDQGLTHKAIRNLCYQQKLSFCEIKSSGVPLR